MADQADSLPLVQSHILLTSFNTFLTVAIHNILYYRRLYPQSTFLSTRAYNLPAHQNRHPKVCTWITDAVSSVASQLSTGQVSRIAVDSCSETTRDILLDHPALNTVDLNEQFRACLIKMAHAMEGLSSIPKGCTFTLAVELKDEAAAPIGVDWIPAEPSGPSSTDRKAKGRDIHPPSRAETAATLKTTPVRVVEAGPLWFECWVEESRAKVALMETNPSHGSV
ncbi:DNA-binding protein [Apiosordaria backusii]|uniref:DNA-binding protein n=1 Tax=Apiosordaria backusii TaxID=314023 RepID=A0AA40K3W3_9PEZI|nr:DNA-binding protein [Apiosordaria backusii]